MYKLKIIIGSTRPGRKGPAIARWIAGVAGQYKDFDIEILDLAEINLPLLDEPNHPRLKNYVHQHTKDWSRMIEDGDAFIFVTPEYNYSYGAALKNAIDYLHQEWQYKPAAFVSYGGLAGGTRAVQALKLVISSLKMTAVNESVNINFFMKYFNKDDVFSGEEMHNTAAKLMLDELLKWTIVLKNMREEKFKVAGNI
jgi:NAD(P)H-dependent FMN reductase